MLPTPDERLVEQRPLDLGVPPPDRRHERGVVELRVHRVAGDVGDLVGQVGTARTDRQATERPLVHEPELRVAVGEPDPYPQVGFVRRTHRTQPELARHAEVREDRRAVVERQPQVLTAPPRIDDRPAGERTNEVECARQMAPDRSRMQHFDRVDRSTDRPRGEALADRFDLRQLGHVRSRTARR